jgi:hypothetical protein
MVALGASMCDDRGVMALIGMCGYATSPRANSVSERKCQALRQGPRELGGGFDGKSDGGESCSAGLCHLGRSTQGNDASSEEHN